MTRLIKGGRRPKEKGKEKEAESLPGAKVPNASLNLKKVALKAKEAKVKSKGANPKAKEVGAKSKEDPPPKAKA